jgi:hypothetical protein
MMWRKWVRVIRLFEGLVMSGLIVIGAVADYVWLWTGEGEVRMKKLKERRKEREDATPFILSIPWLASLLDAQVANGFRSCVLPFSAGCPQIFLPFKRYALYLPKGSCVFPSFSFLPSLYVLLICLPIHSPHNIPFVALCPLFFMRPRTG